MKDTRMKTAVVAGAGPAGLTAASELLKLGVAVPVVCEMSGEIGGISRTVDYKGNRIDIGGHRFFSKNDEIMRWWTGVMSLDADPEKTDRAMLTRRRVSRIYYLRRFFDYPVRMSVQTVRNLGLRRTFRAGLSYLWSAMVKRKEVTLEDFYINRFGKTLYSMFFEDYTEKVWGVHPSRLGADWGAQRVKGLSLGGVLKDMISRKFNGDKQGKEVETSLIGEFIYPKYGPGQLWETVAEDVTARGGKLYMSTTVKHVNVRANKVVSVTVVSPGGEEREIACDYFLSSMPLKDLVGALRGVEVPDAVREAALQLPYRDFITVGLLVDKLKIRNETKFETFDGRIPDTWIYIQERDVKLGRLQIFNNWSPYMVEDYEGKMWIGLEYFCREGDEMWEMPDKDFIDFAVGELVHIGMVDRADVRDGVRIKVKKAYPAYYGSYRYLPEIRKFLDGIGNLYCIGRNGQHRYNNMDHSMLTAMEAVKTISSGHPADKSQIWNVNTETEYHETKQTVAYGAK